MNEDWLLGLLIKPLLFLFVWVCVIYPIVWMAQKLPDSKLKRFLFTRIGK